jgi:hypothetical protein
VGGGPFVVTDPGVLELLGPDVTVVATVPDGGEVTMVVGRDVDVLGWLGADTYVQITGLTDLQTLATTQVVRTGVSPSPTAPSAESVETTAAGETPDDAADESAGPADPAGSDMWIAEVTGTDSATLRWSHRPGRWSLLAVGVGDGAGAPEVQLTWPRAVSTPWVLPAVIGGGVAFLGGVWLLVVSFRRRAGTASDESAEPEAPSVEPSVESAPSVEPGRDQVPNEPEPSVEPAPSVEPEPEPVPEPVAEPEPSVEPAAALAIQEPPTDTRPFVTVQTETGAIRLRTRREIREMEAALRAKQEVGATSEPQTGSFDEPEPEPAAEPRTIPAIRSRAWRQAWGFDAAAAAAAESANARDDAPPAGTDDDTTPLGGGAG